MVSPVTAVKAVQSMFDSPAEPDDPVPLPDDESIDRARRRRLAVSRNRSGRASTALASPSTGTGVDFQKTLLG